MKIHESKLLNNEEISLGTIKKVLYNMPWIISFWWSLNILGWIMFQ